MKSKKRGTLLQNIVFAFLIIWVVVFVFLMLWAIMTSLKGSSDFLNNSKLALPEKWVFDNYTFVIANYYVTILTESGLERVWLENMIFNSIAYALLVPLAGLVMSCWVAYLTAKFNYKFSMIVYTVVVTLLILPIVGTQVSTIVLLKRMGLFDTIFGVALLNFHFVNMNYMIVHAIFSSQPKDIEEAAILDGAGYFRIFWHVAFPSVQGIVFTWYIMGFIGHWNDAANPLIYLPTNPTLAYGVYTLEETSLQGFNYVPVRLATNLLLGITIIVVFTIFSKPLLSRMNFSLGELK